MLHSDSDMLFRSGGLTPCTRHTSYPAAMCSACITLHDTILNPDWARQSCFKQGEE